MALPKSNTSEELKPLKTKSMADTELKRKRTERRNGGRSCEYLCVIIFGGEEERGACHVTYG